MSLRVFETQSCSVISCSIIHSQCWDFCCPGEKYCEAFISGISCSNHNWDEMNFVCRLFIHNDCWHPVRERGHGGRVSGNCLWSQPLRSGPYLHWWAACIQANQVMSASIHVERFTTVRHFFNIYIYNAWCLMRVYSVHSFIGTWK